jgi:RNA polymerase sigma-70 factor (ECF subfamily)
MPGPSESELIARCRKGDRAAFETIVNLHMDRVAGLARRLLSDEHEALDVTQEVFVAAFRVLPTWREEAQLFTWLYRTTVNLCSKRLRARRKIVPARSHEPSVVVPDSAQGAELAQAIEEALESLSDRQRDVFVLCHVQGVPLSEIAPRLGLSLGAVKSHLHRALSTLREKLRGRREV